jgi:hypothetical protein
MALPKPGTVAVELAGEPIHVPRDLDRDGLERERLRVQAALDDVQGRAEAIARGRADPGRGAVQKCADLPGQAAF